MAISWDTVPWKAALPSRRSVTPSANPRISSIRCVAHTTAAPSSASARTSSRMRAAASGSRSCVASSIRSTLGSVRSARAIESRFCIPCE